MELPTFQYHPDPIATGSIVESDIECCCCGEARGYIYADPAYAVGDYDQCICPWCIADGSAHAELGVDFTDEQAIGGYGVWEAVLQPVIEEVAYRTPGFSGWQQEQWWTHCGDAAQFLGLAGREELEAYGPQAIASIQDSAGLGEGADWQRYFAALDRRGSPTAYIFRCSHCGQLGGYTDAD